VRGEPWRDENPREDRLQLYGVTAVGRMNGLPNARTPLRMSQPVACTFMPVVSQEFCWYVAGTTADSVYRFTDERGEHREGQGCRKADRCFGRGILCRGNPKSVIGAK
jgi:hypothetical protein